MSWGKYWKIPNFFFPIEKETGKVDKDANEDIKKNSCKIKFIDSVRSMASSLSNLVDNLAAGIHKIKCKDCNCFLKHKSGNDNLIKYKCLSCNKNYSNKINKNFEK